MVQNLDGVATQVAALRAAPDDLERIRLLRGFTFGANRRGKTAELAMRHRRRARPRRRARRGTRRDPPPGDRRRRPPSRGCTRGFTAEDVAQRRRAGELEFHDLLVLARELLRDPRMGTRVRARLRARYRRLLIDEFQDTDPIQVELAVLLASSDPHGDKPWTDQPIEPGRLFFVGDPKQSIYRFRRADIATFLAARDRFVETPLLLTRNFRTTAPVLDWINRVFDDLIQPFPGSQPAYVALEAARTDLPAGAPVTLLGVDAHEDRPDADTLRDREAADVVAAIRAALAERWQVSDRGGALPRRAARRHLDPVARAHLARLPGARVDRRRHPVPRRDQLAGVRQPRGARHHGRAASRR